MGGSPKDAGGTADRVRMIPASGTKDFEFGVKEPLRGTVAVECDQRRLAFRAPSVRASGIGVVAPTEADALPSVHGIGYVLAYQSDSLCPVLRTINAFGHDLVR